MANKWIVFDGKKQPQFHTVSNHSGIAIKRAENKEGKSWEVLRTNRWTVLNVDIEIKLRE